MEFYKGKDFNEFKTNWIQNEAKEGEVSNNGDEEDVSLDEHHFESESDNFKSSDSFVEEAQVDEEQE